MIDEQTALIYTMVLVSAADRDMTDAELRMIGDIIGHLPIFRNFDSEKLPAVAASCADLLADADGLDRAFDQIKEALPGRLTETAYALACDIAAADGDVQQEELRLLEMVRHRLEVDRLTAAAIERGARARFTVI